MRTIYKYPFQVCDSLQPLEIKGLERVVHVGINPANPYELALWAIVDNESEDLVGFQVFTTGTGHPAPSKPFHYLASLQQGPFMWHVWVSIRPELPHLT